MKPDSVYSKSDQNDDSAAPWPVAVIDVGTTSLRMQVAEIWPDGSIRKLESFSQAVSLGKDSFNNGKISRATIEDCVHVLRIYRERLTEYGITERQQIRVIATSAVKEARNRLAFQDRIFIATGFVVEALDEAELHRVTYFGLLPTIEAHEELAGVSLICEVGGGSTETMILNNSDVLYSQTYRLGSLRLRKKLESYETPGTPPTDMMQTHIFRRVSRMQEKILPLGPERMIALGGDIRFAAKEIRSKSIGEGLLSVDLQQLKDFTTEVLEKSADRLATQYHFSLTDAATLGPALLSYCMIADHLHIEKLYVAEFNLRDGLVQELAGRGRWNLSVQNQITRSAIQLGKRYQFEEAHAIHVAGLSCSLFEQLRELHGLDNRYLGILEMAAILHEIGLFVSVGSFHKHSMYLIMHSEFFGISDRDVGLVALVARYHRRAAPQPNHEYYSQLEREDRVAVAKLAAILRVAKALDANRNQAIKEIKVDFTPAEINLTATSPADISMEKLELNSSRSLFESIFGVGVNLESEN